MRLCFQAVLTANVDQSIISVVAAISALMGILAWFFTDNLLATIAMHSAWNFRLALTWVFLPHTTLLTAHLRLRSLSRWRYGIEASVTICLVLLPALR